MHDDLAALRFQQLVDSPGGRALLVIKAHNGISPADAVEPERSLHLIASAVGALNPWDPWRDRIMERLRHDAPQHADLARALLAEPGIERWWAPLDRDQQVWLQPGPDAEFPAPAAFPTPIKPPNAGERYAQKPQRGITTSTRVGDSSGQLANCLSGASDWLLDYTAQRKLVRISPGARVLEITCARDWHAMVVAHGVRSDPAANAHSSAQNNEPWGGNDGLVPDWSSIAREWDGVHVTLWAFLTGTQTRITSEAGWTEMWASESEETTWLHWVFDGVEEMPPVGPVTVGPHYSLPFSFGTRISAGDR